MWAELARLRAENEALKQTIHDELDGNLRLRELGGARSDEPMPTFLERVFAERDSLRAELAEAQKDAARYRWLKDSHWYIGPAPEGDLIGVSWDDFNDRAGRMDAAIDAAMAREAK